jgi:hypothetical protein
MCRNSFLVGWTPRSTFSRAHFTGYDVVVHDGLVWCRACMNAVCVYRRLCRVSCVVCVSRVMCVMLALFVCSQGDNYFVMSTLHMRDETSFSVEGDYMAQTSTTTVSTVCDVVGLLLRSNIEVLCDTCCAR